MDRTLEDTFFISFTTRSFSTGSPTTLAGTPVVSAYEDANLTQITAGITLGVDHDSVAGFNLLTIVATAANGYEAGKDYQLVITVGTVGGVSVVGEKVEHFSLSLSAAAKAVADLNDVAATEIVSSGAITTLAGAVVNVDLVDTLTTYTGNTPQTADHTAGIADIPTVSEFNARTLASAGYFDPTVDVVANVTLVGTTTTNTDMAGTNNALLAADINLTGGAVDNVTMVTTTTTNTDMRGTDGANTLSPDNAGITANGVAIAALNDITAADVLAAGDIDGFTLEEAQKLILAANVGILAGAATTTVTIQAADGSKARLTATVDSDGNRSLVVKDVTG